MSEKRKRKYAWMHEKKDLRIEKMNVKESETNEGRRFTRTACKVTKKQTKVFAGKGKSTKKDRNKNVDSKNVILQSDWGSTSQSQITYKSPQKELNTILGAMKKVLAEIKSHKNAGPFLQPVDEDYAPNYSSIIKEPMALSIMESKVHNEIYRSRKEFEKDFRLMIKNCEIYNGVENDYTKMAYALWKSFGKLSKKHLPKRRKGSPLRFSYNNGVITSNQRKLYISSSTSSDGSIKIIIRQSATGNSGKNRLTEANGLLAGYSRALDSRIERAVTENSAIQLPVPRIHLERLNLSRNQKRNANGETVYTVSTKRPFSPPCLSKSKQRQSGMRAKKKRKKPIGMKAIEALALAAEQALKDAASRSSFDDSPLSSQGCTPEYDSSAFPDLKISTTQSHPAALVEKLFGAYFPSSNNKINNESNLAINGSDKENEASDKVSFRNCVKESMQQSPIINKTTYSVKLHKEPKNLSISDDSDYGSSGDGDISSCLKLTNSTLTPTMCPPVLSTQIKPCQVSLSRVNPEKVFFKGMKYRIADRYFSQQCHDGYAIKSNLASATRENHEASSIIVQPKNLYSETGFEPVKKEPTIVTECSERLQYSASNSNVPPRKRYSLIMPPITGQKGSADSNIDVTEQHKEVVTTFSGVAKPLGVYEYVTDSEEDTADGDRIQPVYISNSHSSNTIQNESFFTRQKENALKPYAMPLMSQKIYMNPFMNETCHRFEVDAFNAPFVDPKLLTPLNIDINHFRGSHVTSFNMQQKEPWRMS